MHLKHPWLPLICCLTAVTALAACGDATPAPVHHAAGGSGGAGGGTAGGSNQAGTSPGGTSSGGSTAIAGTGGMSAGGTSSGGVAGTDATAGTSTGGTGGNTSGGGTGGAATGGGGTGGSAPVCPAPAATHSATACTRSCWATAASDCANYPDWGLFNPPVNAVDGDPATRFSTGTPQMTPATYQIDLGSAVSVDGIKLDSGTDATDFAQAYEIDVSLDATTWTAVACGAGTTVTDVAFAPTTARYIKVIQNVVNSGSWWSVHELNVYCPATDTCGPDTGGGGTGGTGGAGTGGGGVSGGGAAGNATGGAGTGGDTGGAGTAGGGASSGGASGAGAGGGGASGGGAGGGGASSGGASGAGTGGGGTGGGSALVSTAPTGGFDKCVTQHHN